MESVTTNMYAKVKFFGLLTIFLPQNGTDEIDLSKTIPYSFTTANHIIIFVLRICSHVHIVRSYQCTNHM